MIEILAALAALAWGFAEITMGKVLTKAGVSFQTIGAEGFTILGAVDRASRTFDVNLTITSAWRDDPGSMHGTGQAVDLSVINLTPAQIVALYYWFTAELGPRFTVLYEVPPSTVPQLPAILRAIAYSNTNATAPHFHIQAKRTA
jgi:hypothetical protein